MRAPQGKEDLVDETGTNLASPQTAGAGAGPPRTASSPQKASWITGGSLLRATWRLSLPMVAAALFHDLFSLVDLFFVGRLGAGAISAVTISGALMGILHMLVRGIVTGSTALVAQAVGAGNRARAEKAAAQSFLMAVVLSLAAVAAMPLAPTFLRALGAQTDVVAAGTPYLRIILGGSVAMFLNVAFAAALRSAGDAVTPLKIMALGNLINIALDPILIFGWGGIPAMGVAGSAMATVIASAIAAILMARVFFIRGHDHFHLRLTDLRPDWGTIWRMFRIGVFGSGQMLMRNVSALALVRVVAIFGTVPLAAYGVGLRVRMAIMMPGIGFGGAAATLVGQNLGASKPRRAERAGWLATGMYAMFAVAVGACLLAFAEQLIGVFNSEPDVVRVGGEFLRWLSFTFVFMSFSMVLGRAMHGAGDTLVPMLVTAGAMLMLRIPLAYGLSQLWNSEVGVWAGIAASNVVQGLFFVGAFRWGRWKAVGRRHVEAQMASLNGEV